MPSRHGRHDAAREMTHHFCTYFDRNYLTRGLALYESLRRQCPSFELWILCLDETSHEALSKLKLPATHLIALAQLEREDAQLRDVKTTRTQVEYYFTCSPCLPLFLLRQVPAIDQITYLDADLFFFRDPALVFAEVKQASIAIIPHRFHPAFEDRTRFGRYNVGWISFRRDEQGLACLTRWREQCLEWCYARCELDRFADQKYLDPWPTRYRDVCVIQHKGANVAPWNVANYNLSNSSSGVYVDEQPLVFYHFHYLKRVNKWVYNLGLSEYGTVPGPVLRHQIYGPYLRALSDGETTLRSVLNDSLSRPAEKSSDADSASYAGEVLSTVSVARNAIGLLRGLVSGHYIFVPQ